WSESWLSTSSHLPICGPPKEIDRDLVVADLLVRDSVQWNRQKIESILPSVAHLIYQIFPSSLKAEDRFCWQRTKSGIYSVRSAPALVCLPPTGITTDLFSWLCWNLWTARNRLIFENRVTSHAAVVTNALVNAREWNQAQKIPSPPGPTPTSAPLYHAPLPPDTSLCNSDASWSRQSLQAGLGWILVNETLPHALFGSSCCNYVTSPFLAEALAIRECLRAARTAQVTKVWMRSDSQSLIRAINSKTYPMELFGVLMDIELLSSTFAFILLGLTHVEDGLDNAIHNLNRIR
ncbi:hypothetical protein IGI04_016771, partial [Brassica rapa subsp. trilocularis]